MFPDLEQNSVYINGTKFNYHRTVGMKDLEKPVLVLQHGFSDNGLCWAPVAEELDGDYDIIMPDARGHGQSARVARGEDIDQAGDLAALLGALGVKKAVVAGHSMGAQIAAELGARFPELVSALVLEDPPWFIPRPDDLGSPRGTMEESPMGKWMISLKEKTLDLIMEECRAEHPNWGDAYVRAWCQGKLELDINFLAGERHWGGWEEQIAKLLCPTLLITAEPGMGGIVTPDVVAMVKERNPRIQVVNFAGVGHHVRFAVHEAYMQTVKVFLSSIH